MCANKSEIIPRHCGIPSIYINLSHPMLLSNTYARMTFPVLCYSAIKFFFGQQFLTHELYYQGIKHRAGNAVSRVYLLVAAMCGSCYGRKIFDRVHNHYVLHYVLTLHTHPMVFVVYLITFLLTKYATKTNVLIT